MDPKKTALITMLLICQRRFRFDPQSPFWD
jgi:hypothetical protein